MDTKMYSIGGECRDVRKNDINGPDMPPPPSRFAVRLATPPAALRPLDAIAVSATAKPTCSDFYIPRTVGIAALFGAEASSKHYVRVATTVLSRGPLLLLLCYQIYI